MADQLGSNFSLTATGTAELGANQAGNGRGKTARIIALDGTFVGSVVVKGRVRGSAAGAATYKTLPYKRRVLADAASDDTIVSAALTGKSIIEVDDTSLELQLDFTWTSGTLLVTQRHHNQ